MNRLTQLPQEDGPLFDNEIKRLANRILPITVLSGTFAIDSTGVKTVTIAHGIGVIPAAKDCYLTVIEVTNVDDFAFNMIKIESTDITNVVAKINISTASGTASAVARLGLLVITH